MQEFLDTSVNDYFEVDKHSIKSYVWPGKRKGILFLHGWRSNAARWKYLISGLKDLNVDLISVDAPGHGASNHPEFNPPNYARVIQPLIEKYQPKIIVGHSVGAYTALLHYEMYKPKGIKYVLLAPTYDMMLPINKMFEILKLSKRTQKAYIDFVEKGAQRSLADLRADNFVSASGPEGILVHDVNDKILPYEDSLKIMEKATALKFHRIKSNGHRMQNDDVLDLIKEYITGYFSA